MGAGVSGATAARLFARAGHRVLLVERSEFPRYKVCGSCLNLRAATFLSLGGIDTRLQAQGAMSLREARIAIAGKSATIALPGESQFPGRCWTARLSTPRAKTACVSAQDHCDTWCLFCAGAQPLPDAGRGAIRNRKEGS